MLGCEERCRRHQTAGCHEKDEAEGTEAHEDDRRNDQRGEQVVRHPLLQTKLAGQQPANQLEPPGAQQQRSGAGKDQGRQKQG